MTIRRRALSDGPLGGPQPVTTVQRIVRASVAWQPRNGAAVLPIRILVSGETARVVPDLCREIAAKLGYVYGSMSQNRGSVHLSYAAIFGPILRSLAPVVSVIRDELLRGASSSPLLPRL